MTLDRALAEHLVLKNIQLDDLSNGPGLLPFNLGKTKIASHNHIFLQEIHLDKIQAQIDLLKTQLTNSINKLNNQFFSVFKYQISHLFNKINKIYSQLETFIPKRVKRGLIDPLGTLIKSLTGNLDHEDALRFENAIKVLQKNDESLSNTLSRHISLNKDLIVQQTNVMSNLSSNQRKLEQAVSYLLNKSDNDSSTQYIRLSQIFNVLGENIEDLTLEITRLENVLAFSHLSTMHHSVLSTAEIRNMLKKLNSLYNPNQILNLDTRYYYSLIKLGSYYVENKLVLVLKFPILSSISYDFYRLCPVPNKRSEIILPPFPFIATNLEEYVYMEAECPKIDTWYVCEQKTILQKRTHRDCTYNLLYQLELDNLCHPTSVSLFKEALLELDSQHYIISFPKPTKVEISCEQEEHRLLQGSYFATIPRNCHIRTPEFTVINLDDKILGHAVELISIQSEATENTENRLPHYNLTTINLSKLHDIQNQVLMTVPEKLENVDLSTIYHTTLPLYGITVLGASALIVLYYLSRRQRAAAIISPTQSNIEMTGFDSSAPEIPETSIPDRRAAIFALNLHK